MRGAFHLVDVFGTDDVSGNPHAVMAGGEPAGRARMQAVAPPEEKKRGRPDRRS